jgi:alkylation response protein AidB-like acyl-CoA dehydrogenase
MVDYLVPTDLLEFLLFDWLEPHEPSDFDRNSARSILDTAYRLAKETFAPSYKLADTSEPWLDADGVHALPEFRHALASYAELGLFGASFPDELGGLGMPQALASAVHAIFASANISAAGYALLTAGNARLIANFGTPTQIDTFARPEIQGRWFGTMCLSEPQAGSSLGDITTRAVSEGEDPLGARYRVFGNKMWISGGDHDLSENIVHLVLAKIQHAHGSSPPGSKGISLFIVPKVLPDGTRNDVRVAGLNHKMGNRGTTNCLLNLGENGGAVGWRVGAENRGLAQMFQMMNEARIGVGLGAAALAYRGYRHAVRYADERKQGRPIGVTDGAPISIAAHPDVAGMLIRQKVYAEGALALCLYCASLVDRRDEDAEALLALLTPVAKSWPSEFGLIANDLAIQVHGGYGYTRDFDVEQLWRDNRLNAIHEGTAGIQAIDLLRRKLLLSDGRGLALLRARIAKSLDAASADEELAALAMDLNAYWDEIARVLTGLEAEGGDCVFDDATMFLRAFGHGVVGWLWLDLALAAKRASSARIPGTVHATRYFSIHELPEARAWLSIVASRSKLAREVPAEIFC